jgi:hypothetical protein
MNNENNFILKSDIDCESQYMADSLYERNLNTDSNIDDSVYKLNDNYKSKKPI